jgi:hypothetical protein
MLQNLPLLCAWCFGNQNVASRSPSPEPVRDRERRAAGSDSKGFAMTSNESDEANVH